MLQDGFRAMEKAFEKMAPSGPAYVQATPSRNGYAAALPTPEATEDELAYVEAELVQQTKEQEIPRQQTATQKKKRTLKAVEPLKNVDWESSTPFRTYAEERNPSTNHEKFLSRWRLVS